MQSNEQVQKFSIFQNHYKNAATVSFEQITDAIINGRFKVQVEKIQQLNASGKSEEANKEKQKLDAFTPSGVFTGRRITENLKSYNQLIIIDFDKLDNPILEECIITARNIEYTNCAFVSPSGKGFKVLVKVDSEKEYHKVAFEQVAEYYEKELNIKIDRSGSDITRLCYIPFDPNLYSNENSSVFHVDIKTDISIVEIKQSLENEDSFKEYLYAVKYTNNVAKYKEHTRNNFIYTLAKNCNERKISLEEAIAFITKDYGYDQMRDEASIKSGYNQPVKEIIIKKTPVFSLNYLHSKKFKSEIKMDSRALFEVLLMKYLHFRKPFYYSRAAIKNDLGINKDRAITIINYLKTIGFLDFKVQTTQLNGSPRQTTYFTVYPENIPNVIDQLMENGDEVIRRLKPFLDSDERIDIGYGYQE